jgi:hypothetical protein
MNLSFRSVKIGLLSLLIWSGRGEAQASPELRHLRRPLLDMVILPDSSSGVWLLVAPNPATKDWETGSHLVSLPTDPVLALQWVMVARAITRTDPSGRSPTRPAAVTPPLRARRGPAFVVLARNSAKAGPAETFLLAVSDSQSRTAWKAYASSAQVDTFLNTLEAVALDARTMASPPGSAAAEEDSVDVPVAIVTIPEPEYPRELASKRRIGRVWISYVVGADGRAVEGSFQPVLSDDPLFTRAAVQALLRGKYRPARLHDHPVRQRVFQVITFRTR